MTSMLSGNVIFDDHSYNNGRNIAMGRVFCEEGTGPPPSYIPLPAHLEARLLRFAKGLKKAKLAEAPDGNPVIVFW